MGHALSVLHDKMCATHKFTEGTWMHFSISLLFFFIVLIGIHISRLKIGGMSLDLSALLIVAILFGWLGEKFGILSDGEDVRISTELLSSLGTSIFVAAVGILTGQGMQYGRFKQSVHGFMLGMVGVLTGYFCMRIILWLDVTVDKSALYGVFCGAMTSTPALTAVCEMENISAEMAALGYGYAYILGVVGVVLFVQITSPAALSTVKSVAKETDRNSCRGETVLACIACCVIVGTLIGRWQTPFAKFSFGTTGGVLIVSTLVGFWASRKRIIFDSVQLSIYRNLGLMFFFVGTGIRAGRQMTGALQLRWILYGGIITGAAMLLTYFISRRLCKRSVPETLCITAGAMTSTPAIGALLKKESVAHSELLSYSAAYMGALLCIVVVSRI